MTEASHGWNPMPHRVDVRCVECDSHAYFEFAEVIEIHRKEDIEYFKKSRVFEYRKLRKFGGGDWHAAIFYPGLHGNTDEAVADLPEGYTPVNWAHSKYLSRSHSLDIGTIVCPTCGLRRKHWLDWPGDAWYQAAHRGQVVWAFDRESARVLRDFIATHEGERGTDRWRRFLRRHVPKESLNDRTRASLTRRLDQLLHPH
jgi:hypothetical protein